jgi:3-oxoacyl-[acyl-carrier protein] reductase
MRTAVITGSTSGIGKAIALRLLGAGYNVVLNYASDDDRAAAALAECERVGGSVRLIKADVGDSQSASRLIESTADEYDSLDVLVNNAARVIDRPILEMTEDEWDSVINANLKGAFLCSQRAARYMIRQQEGGTIINIGASTGIRGRLNGVNTCASKAGLMLMTQCFALEFGPKIRVNTIVPGLTQTPETEQRFRLDDLEARRLRAESVPLRRIGQPSDVADAVMLLLSDQARFITGQRLIVDGGQYMW